LVERLDEAPEWTTVEFFDRLESSVSGDRISIGMTQQRLAEELGTVREVVSREIKNLVDSGY
jgi:CRP-like cAMP-binding protein